jgi:molybdenum cofactor biosynthesis enzyme MoaA/CheY-like chemotaxis protein
MLKMQKKRVCWNITTKCNQNCKYCHRFLGINDLTYEENKEILNNLIKDGVNNITWTGGEALLYPNLKELLKISQENGIKNKLITNGMVLAQNENMREILDYLDSLTLSLDTINDDTNEELGRGKNHFEEVKTILDYVKGKSLKVNINTVVSKKNINEMEQLGEFLNNYNISKWKFFKFMPLRETAEKNKDEFAITDAEFEKTKNVFRNFGNIGETDFRQEKDMEDKYTLLIANGDIIKTEHGVDVKKGNALYQNPVEFMYELEENRMKKIKILIAHNNEEIRNKIADTIKGLDYVELVDTATDGKETYNKIIESKPEMVFAKMNLDNMDSMEIMRKSKESLKDNVPIFNIITSDNVSDEYMKTAYNLMGRNLNTFVSEPINNMEIDNIMQGYKELKENA